MSDVASEPWEKLETETAKSYAAFCLYRDFGPSKRSYEAVTSILYPGKPGNTSGIFRWSRTHNWRERAEAWDKELDRQRRTIILEANKAVTMRHIELAQAMLQKGLEALKLVDTKEVNVDQARLLIEAGAKLERLARGEATERIDTHDGISIYETEFTRLTEGELRKVIELAGRSEGVGSEGAGEETPVGLLSEGIPPDAGGTSPEVVNPS